MSTHPPCHISLGPMAYDNLRKGLHRNGLKKIGSPLSSSICKLESATSGSTRSTLSLGGIESTTPRPTGSTLSLGGIESITSRSTRSTLSLGGINPPKSLFHSIEPGKPQSYSSVAAICGCTRLFWAGRASGWAGFWGVGGVEGFTEELPTTDADLKI